MPTPGTAVFALCALGAREVPAGRTTSPAHAVHAPTQLRASQITEQHRTARFCRGSCVLKAADSCRGTWWRSLLPFRHGKTLGPGTRARDTEMVNPPASQWCACTPLRHSVAQHCRPSDVAQCTPRFAQPKCTCAPQSTRASGLARHEGPAHLRHTAMLSLAPTPGQPLFI